MRIEGGKLAISGDDSSTSADLTAKYGLFTSASFSAISTFGYSGGSGPGGIASTLYPKIDNS